MQSFTNTAKKPPQQNPGLGFIDFFKSIVGMKPETEEEKWVRLIAAAMKGDVTNIAALEEMLSQKIHAEQLKALNSAIGQLSQKDLTAITTPTILGCFFWLQGKVMQNEIKADQQQNWQEVQQLYRRAANFGFGPAIFDLHNRDKVMSIENAIRAIRGGSRQVIAHLLNAQVAVAVEVVKDIYETCCSTQTNKKVFYTSILKEFGESIKNKFEKSVLTINEFKILYYCSPAFPEKRLVIHHKEGGEMYNSFSAVIEKLIVNEPAEFERLYNGDKCRAHCGEEQEIREEIAAAKRNKIQREQVKLHILSNELEAQRQLAKKEDQAKNPFNSLGDLDL